jgi:thiol:disulfide interchange protein
MNDLARGKLLKIVKAYGRTVCNTPRTCEIFLQQQCADFPAECQLLIKALHVGTVAELLELKGAQPWAEVIAPLVRALADGAGVPAEDARWAVDSWALALGTHPDTAVPPPVLLVEAPAEQAPSPVANSRIWPPFIVGLGGSIGACLATLLFTLLIYTLISGPRVPGGRAGAIAVLVGIVLAIAGAAGGGIGGAIGWLLIQAQTLPTPRAAELARLRLVRGFLSTLAAAAGATLLGGWLIGLLGIALGALVGGFSGAVVSGMKG